MKRIKKTLFKTNRLKVFKLILKELNLFISPVSLRLHNIVKMNKKRRLKIVNKEINLE
jgi:hypothetical protein